MTHRFRILLVGATLAAVACGSAPVAVPSSPASGVPTTVTYCIDGGKALSLDVYEPPTGAEPHPLLIFVHGGSWAFGSSRLNQQNQLTKGVVAAVLSRGFAVASVNYRLAPADPWPAQIIDLRCAIRYLHATAARWHVDTARFAGMGNSAGAQLVSLAALSVGQVPQWNNSQYSAESDALVAVVDCWGPIDLTASGWSPSALEIGQVVFSVSWGTDNDTLREASPVTYLHAGAPPFLIVQGTADQLVPAAQSVEFRDRLVAAGDVATLVDVSHAAHELIPTGGAISPDIGVLTEQVTAFLVSTAG